jgi:hypothetical protein
MSGMRRRKRRDLKFSIAEWNKECGGHTREIPPLSVHTRQKSIPEMGKTQSPFNTLRIDKKPVPLLTIYSCLSIVIGSC